jgi:crossover junction endodeoxyribonuclease RuvC
VKWFFEDLGAGNDLIFIGIDPGSEGAISFIHPTMSSRHTSVDMPTIKVEINKKTKKGNKSKRTVYDIGLIWEYFKIIKEWRHRVVVCIEKMQPRNVDTALTGFSMGAAFHMWPLFLHSHEIVFEEIMPAVWKRKMGLIGKDKEASRLKAQQLFPSAPLSRKGDDGRAEAFLIAEAVKRRRNEP